MNQRRLSTARSNVSSDSPQVDTAVIIKKDWSRIRGTAEQKSTAPAMGFIQPKKSLNEIGITPNDRPKGRLTYSPTQHQLIRNSATE